MGNRNSIGEHFVAHPQEMRASPAWAVLGWNARRVLDHLELEHMAHGGAENGSLVATYDQLAGRGLRRQSIGAAIRECVALGFIEVTQTGGRSYGGSRAPSKYRLTYVVGRKKNRTPSHDWRKHKTLEDALKAVAKAGNKNISPGAKLNPAPGAKMHPKLKIPGCKNAPPSLGANSHLLSISRVGKRTGGERSARPKRAVASEPSAAPTSQPASSKPSSAIEPASGVDVAIARLAESRSRRGAA